MTRRIVTPLTLLMLAACSSGDDGDAVGPTGLDAVVETVDSEADSREADSRADSRAESGAIEATATSDDASVTTPSTVADATTPTTVAEAVPVVPLLNGALLIPALTPAVVDELRPVLEWEPVDGAAKYSVVVLDESGEPYWIWSGPESKITLGGAPSPDFGLGPIVGVDYSWSVAAFAVEGEFLAISGAVPISTE